MTIGHRNAYICEDPVAIFVHVARTAGASIRSALGIDTEPVAYHKFPWHLRQKWFTFAAVRLPYSRAVSLWSWDLANGADYALDEWLVAALEGGCPEAGSQAEYLHGVRLDEVLRFESLPHDLKLLPFWADRQLPHVHVGEHGPWQEYMTPRIAKLIRKWAGRDFEQFGYNKELS